MKQIIVNVSGLTIGEKQRVNEALAKVTGLNKSVSNLGMAKWMYAPSSYIDDQITHSDGNKSTASKGSTHTPQQVLEMAGMTAHRKVRKDFDPTKEYSVDVSGCTEDEKKEVQRAFFDVGILWSVENVKEHKRLNALQYSNTNGYGHVCTFLMYASTTHMCNMTPAEFLDLVYEPEQQGHVHAENMALYAADAKTTDKPWKLWQTTTADHPWCDLKRNPEWNPLCLYRRKPSR